MTPRMPVLFLGHGNPMNAITDNAWSRAWAEIGRLLPRPRAVLAVSAHWYVPEVAVTAMARPRTIHDFGGFPQALFDVRYPAPGDPALARRVQALLAPAAVRLDAAWGLDHGTWSVLRHVFPDADVPVVQLSINRAEAARFHYALGQRLRALRDEGVLVLGSGNVAHNLRAYAWDGGAAALDWAARFEDRVCELIGAGAHGALVEGAALGPDAALAVPTPDHWLPLLYVLGASTAGEPVRLFSRGRMDGGSMSMLSVLIGGGGASFDRLRTNGGVMRGGRARPSSRTARCADPGPTRPRRSVMEPCDGCRGVCAARKWIPDLAARC